MKSQKIYWPWGLGPRNYIWANWVQKTYQAISLEPLLQFTKAGLHFIKNHGMNPVKLWNLKKVFLALGSTFRSLGPEDIFGHKSRTVAPFSTSRTSFSQKSWDNPIKSWDLKKIWLWLLGPRNYIWASWA